MGGKERTWRRTSVTAASLTSWFSCPYSATGREPERSRPGRQWTWAGSANSPPEGPPQEPQRRRAKACPASRDRRMPASAARHRRGRRAGQVRREDQDSASSRLVCLSDIELRFAPTSRDPPVKKLCQPTNFSGSISTFVVSSSAGGPDHGLETAGVLSLSAGGDAAARLETRTDQRSSDTGLPPASAVSWARSCAVRSSVLRRTSGVPSLASRRIRRGPTKNSRSRTSHRERSRSTEGTWPRRMSRIISGEP